MHHLLCSSACCINYFWFMDLILPSSQGFRISQNDVGNIFFFMALIWHCCNINVYTFHDYFLTLLRAKKQLISVWKIQLEMLSTTLWLFKKICFFFNKHGCELINYCLNAIIKNHWFYLIIAISSLNMFVFANQ